MPPASNRIGVEVCRVVAVTSPTLLPTGSTSLHVGRPIMPIYPCLDAKRTRPSSAHSPSVRGAVREIPSGRAV
jgi:hypothetical protein